MGGLKRNHALLDLNIVMDTLHAIYLICGDFVHFYAVF